jgi:hypothetical protein
VQLSIGDKVHTGKVTRRKRGLDGAARGKAIANPILDTRTYNVEFPDGHSEEYTANVITENMYAQCDPSNLPRNKVSHDIWREDGRLPPRGTVRGRRTHN